MKFTCNTKPLAESVALGVINANVSNFHKKSCLVKLKATETELVISIESSMICTEIRVKGHGELDGTDYCSAFVDSLIFKQLISTLDTNLTSLEFLEGGVIVGSGKSRFTLPKMVDGEELDLATPNSAAANSSTFTAIDKAPWKFIKDKQMYSVSMSFIHPVYTKVWLGESGDVLVGDFDTSLFTHSNKQTLGRTCLVSDTIVNLFISLPEGAQLALTDRSYLIKVNTDGYSYLTEFTPLYEDNGDVGNYHSEIFLDMMDHPDTYFETDVSAINKSLNQALLLSSGSEETVDFQLDSSLHVYNRSVDCDVAFNAHGSVEDFKIKFRLDTLKKVLSNYGDSKVCMSVIWQEGEPSGLLVWDDELTTVVAGV